MLYTLSDLFACSTNEHKPILPSELTTFNVFLFSYAVVVLTQQQITDVAIGGMQKQQMMGYGLYI